MATEELARDREGITGGRIMKIISFSWTTPALLAGAKTVTRREWSDDYAKSFHKGDFVAAYDRGPRSGGKQIATIRLTQDPYQEHVASAPYQDYEAEGLAWIESKGLMIQGVSPYDFWLEWRDENPLVWVIKFEVVKYGQD